MMPEGRQVGSRMGSYFFACILFLDPLIDKGKQGLVLSRTSCVPQGFNSEHECPQVF